MTENYNREKSGLEIAIVGMSGKFPGAENIHEYWENLKNGVMSIRFFNKEELAALDVDPEMLDDPNFIGSKGILKNPEYFDAFFFGYSPLEAEIMDPQVRIFYEVCWDTLEDAGCDPSTFNGPIGVYAAASSNKWWEVLTMISGKNDVLGRFNADILCDKDFLSTRIAYKLDLKGPAITIHTACSSALVGVDLACRALLTGQCDAALAGGVSGLPESARGGGYLYTQGSIVSKDGYIRAFDSKAAGTVFSHGSAAVLLKRLDDAIANRDDIYAVIIGFNVNNDGVRKTSFSAPSVDGQVEVMRTALYMADVKPESITYIETHGTGTEIGDPIEIEALSTAYKTDKKGYCAIASVKTNIGHLDVAAGLASLVKASLSIRHKLLPPSLNYETPNPKIDFDNSPFFVNTKLREWNNDGNPLRAGVSSFGVGGTNAHLILEEPPMRESGGKSRNWQLLTLSARNTAALEQSTKNIAQYLTTFSEIPLEDIAYTLKTGRKSFENRKYVVCKNTRDAINILNADIDKTQALPNYVSREEKRVVFMFPGQGSQYVDMGLGLYNNEPLFRGEMDRCFAILKPILGCDLKEILYPDKEKPFDPERINQTEITQPVIFSIEYALAKLLMAWGIEPYAMIGHSIGEYVAACLSGVFSLEDALYIVGWRGKLMQQMPSGGMLSVQLPEKELEPLLVTENDLAFAAVNGPTLCVVAGPHEAIDSFAAKLEEKGIQCRKLHTSHAFHSKMMDPILESFQRKVAEVKTGDPEIPFISNVSGKWITFQDAKNPGYWSKHLRSAVRFADGLQELLKEKNSLFIEVGPGRTLETFVKQHQDKKNEHMTVNLVRHPKEEVEDEYYLLTKLGMIWLYGKSVSWKKYYAEEKRNIIHLPTYPYQRQYFWIEGNPIRAFKEGGRGQASLGKRSNITEWFYSPSWKRTPSSPMAIEIESNHPWLILVGENRFALKLIEKIKGPELIIVKSGERFEKLGDGSYTIDPLVEKDYEMLMADIRARGKENAPNRIIHTLTLSNDETRTAGVELENKYIDLGFYSLLYLVRSLGALEVVEKKEITVLTNGVEEVYEEGVVFPEKAVVMGPVLIIPREYPDTGCRCIDIQLSGLSNEKEEWLFGQTINEFNTEIKDNEPVIAFRGKYRMVKTYEQTLIDKNDLSRLRFKQGGVYLVTGGLGGIGLELSRYLAKTVQAKLIITGRSALPPREEWEKWLETHNSMDGTCQRIRKVRELEELGAEVSVYGVDVTDAQGMNNMVKKSLEHYGTINGVIHSAGVPGGGVIQLKTHEIADKVLEPKVKGSLNLHRALEGISLDFFIMCSSIGAVIPSLGQVDYCSANAFMDAFAFYKRSLDGTFAVSINWDAWREVGMAVEAVKNFAGDKSKDSALHPFTHHLFDHYTPVPKPGPLGSFIYIFTTYFNVNRHWVLNEHMTQNENGMIPGVTYLEMAVASLKKISGNDKGVVELRNVAFLNPLILERGKERETQTILKTGKKGFEFHIRSRVTSGSDEWQSHAQGEIEMIMAEDNVPVKHNLKEIYSRCTGEEIDMVARWRPRAETNLILFGERWGNMRKINFGNKEGIGLFELAEPYREDVNGFSLYPALLDHAVVFLIVGMELKNAHIPYSYKRLISKHPFPSRIYSYGTKVESNEPQEGYLKFNLTIMDEEGIELAIVEEFTLLEITEEIMAKLKVKESAATDVSPKHITTEKEHHSKDIIPKEELIKDGISPSEGLEAFLRILGKGLPQVIVSTQDFPVRLAGAYSTDLTRSAEGAQDSGAPVSLHARPEISSTYVAPSTEAEKRVALIWQDILGIEHIGVMDDFFELGGDSLKANVVITRIKKEFNAEITIRELFNTPRIKDIAAHIESSKDDPASYFIIEPVEERPFYPLSSMQRKLFILNEMEGIGVAYNLPIIIRLSGKVNLEFLERILIKLIERHESYRTSFVLNGTEPVQIIHKIGEIDFHVERIEAAEEDIDKCFREFIRPFDLSKAPLLRAGLIEVKDNYALIIDVHHIVSDATSYLIMVRDVMNMVENKELPEIKLQYKDYVGWLMSDKGKKALKKQEEFWLTQFDKAKGIPVLQLYTDYPRPSVQSFEGDRVNFKFDKDVAQQLDKLIIHSGTTLYMMLLAVFNILLSKYSGQEDIIVGTPIAGRSHIEFENVIGAFINAVAMRNYPVGKKTFTEFLGEVRENTLRAFENQGYPFGDLIEKLGLNREVSRNPLYDVELIVQNISIAGRSVAETAKTRRFESQNTQLDLSVEAVAGDEGIDFVVTFCTRLFKKETIEKFIDFFKRIVITILEKPDIKLEEIKVTHELGMAESGSIKVDEIKFDF